MKNDRWFVYIIESSNGRLYTGITTDVERRFKEHLTSPKGAKFFRSTKPKQVIFTKSFVGRSLASKYEAYIKKLPRHKKIELVENAA
jgi:putative endonuclease